jgi:hypothetical protein
MKNLPLLSIAIIALLSCASAPKPQEETGQLTRGEGLAGLRLAVLQPAGVNIPQSQEWLLSAIQGSLAGDFNQYSKMAVLDRQYLDRILAEQQLSLSGHFSDDDYIKIGHLANAQCVLVGSLQKTGGDGFILDLAIADAETARRLASFGPKRYALADMESLLAPKEAALELMRQTGIEFTEAGRKKFFEAALPPALAEGAPGSVQSGGVRYVVTKDGISIAGIGSLAIDAEILPGETIDGYLKKFSYLKAVSPNILFDERNVFDLPIMYSFDEYSRKLVSTTITDSHESKEDLFNEVLKNWILNGDNVEDRKVPGARKVLWNDTLFLGNGKYRIRQMLDRNYDFGNGYTELLFVIDYL